MSDIPGSQQPQTEVLEQSQPPKVSKPKDSKSEEHGSGSDLAGTVFDSQSFTRVDQVLESLSAVTSLQDIFDLVLNGTHSPKLDVDKFVPYSMAFSKRGVPILGNGYSYRNYVKGGSTYSGQPTHFDNFVWNLDFNTTGTINGYLLPSEEKLQIKWSSEAVSGFLTKAATFGQGQIDQGVRNTRALARYVLGDAQALLVSDIDTVYRNLRTDTFANWMYNSINSGITGDLYIINATELINYLNTNVNTFPIPVNTVCLNLPTGAGDATLGKLAIFSKDVFIDWNNSVTNNALYHGLNARKVARAPVNSCDLDIAEILSRTYSPTEAEIGIFLSTFWFPNIGYDASGDYILDVNIFENTIQDQALNFYYGGGKSTNTWMPTNVNELRAMTWSFRLAKTMLMQKSCMMDGAYVGHTQVFNGKSIELQNLYDDISGTINISPDALGTLNNELLPAWIPFEFYIQNGAKLELDDEDLVCGESPYDTNAKFKVPKSICMVQDATSYNSNTLTYQPVSWFEPNSEGPAMTLNQVVSNWFNTCVPYTVKRYSSDTNTASTPYENLDMVYYRSVRRGKNHNRVVRETLGF